MSTRSTASPPCPKPPLTIGDVIACIDKRTDLEPDRRADLASALRTICRALKAEPESLVVNLRHLRKALASVSPASVGISPGRWSNVRSLALAALNMAGIRSLPGRYREPLPPAWEALRAQLPGDEAESRA